MLDPSRRAKTQPSQIPTTGWMASGQNGPQHREGAPDQKHNMPARKLEADSPLTPQQETFVTHYVVGGLANAYQAALDSGYALGSARGTASRLLAKTNIKAAVVRKQALVAVRSDYSITTWLNDVQATINEARAAGAYGPAMRGYELLGRHIGALKQDRGLSTDEKRMYTWLGAEMQRAGKAEAAEVQGRALTD